MSDRKVIAGMEQPHEKALQEMMIAAGSLLDPLALAKLTVSHLRELTGADGAALYWWDEGEELLLPLAYLDPSGQRPRPVFHAGQGVTGAAFATGRAIIANDYLNDVANPATWAIDDEGIRAIAAVPLMVEGTPKGVLSLIQRRDGDLTKDQLNLMEIVGVQVAPALYGMRLLAHAKFCQSQAEELAALMRDGARSSDLASLLHQISMVSCRLHGADFTGVAMPGDHFNSWGSVYGNRSEVWSQSGYRDHLGSLVQMRPGAAPFVLSSEERDGFELLAKMPLASAEGLQTVLVVPLTGDDGALVGGLMLGWRFALVPSEAAVTMASTLGGCATALLVQARTTALLHDRERELRHQAFHDPLTGLANRRLFFEQLEQRIQTQGPNGQGEWSMAVVLLDVIGLRRLNARHGHGVGDELVMQLGRRLRDAVEGPDESGADLLAQMADDTFAAFLRIYPDEPVAATLEHRVFQAFDQPFLLGGQPLTIKARFGAALIPRDGKSAERVLRCADTALTIAHRTNQRFVLYDPDHQRDDERQQVLIADLRRALPAGELTMAFQPIVDATDGRLVHAEALARWDHPVYGAIAPEVFVALAQECGLMASLTEWALDTALAECAVWQHEKPGVGVAVNVTYADLQSLAFPGLIESLLERQRVTAPLLSLEMTETTLMEDFETILQVLRKVSGSGIELALDDFGTGYSSLTYLRRLPVRIVKIDNSFVTNMLHDTEDTAIVAMVVALSRTLGLSTIAEGVEDEETGTRLGEFGVDCLQGYGVGRPMAASAFRAWSATVAG